MKIEKIDIDGKKNSIEVLDKIFSGKINKKLVDNLLYKSIANNKGRKAKTKQKNEIIGSTAKIYAQKGTGNARHASRKAPIFVGGGVAHGPKGESSYKKKKMNKNKEMSLLLKKFNSTNALIILDKLSKENIYRSIKNIPNIKVTDINHFNAFDIVKFEKIIFTESSVKELEKRYA